MEGLTIGRIVHYVLTEQDAEEISRRRTSSHNINQAVAANEWPTGAQAHIGNSVRAGDHVAAIVVCVFNEETGMANLHCILDGTDCFWATSRDMGEGEFTWHWPERV